MMTSEKPNPRKGEPYSTNAYFEMVMNRNVYKVIPDRVLDNPKVTKEEAHVCDLRRTSGADMYPLRKQFWEFLESTRSEPKCEEWAEEMLTRNLDDIVDRIDRIGAIGKALEEASGMLHESGGTREAAIRSVLKGKKFEFLRDVYCMVDDEEEEEEEEGEEEEKGEGENQESDIQGSNNLRSSEPETKAEHRRFDMGAATAWEPKDRYCLNGRSRSSVSEAKAEQENLARDVVKTRRVWEWTRHDAEAENWLFERLSKRNANGIGWLSRAKHDKTWEWTQYDSEAEVEEAERTSLKELRERDEAERSSLERMRRSNS